MLAEIKTLSNRKEEVLEEARRLFSQKGYASASMRDLAVALGIKPASLYSNFDKKEDMLWEIALRCARSFFETVEPISQQNIGLAEKLEKMFAAHIDVVIKNRDASTIFFEQWKYLGEERRQRYASYMHGYEQQFINVIEKGIEQGIFQALTPHFVTLTLLSSANWIGRWYKDGGPMSKAEVKKQLLSLMMNGIRKPEIPAQP